MASRRDPWLDNVKMLLVTLVVIGHTVPMVGRSDWANQTYDFIYYFHIPAFVLVTGYLSRSFTWSRRHLLALVTTLAVPYTIFEPALVAYRRAIGLEVGEAPMWLEPHWTMWYLVAVFFWRLATPVLKVHWVMLPASVVVSVASGFFELPELALDRILALLPFFVAGLYLRPEHLELLRPARWMPVGLAGLAVLWWWAGRTDDWAVTRYLLWDRPYADFVRYGFSDGDSVRIRLTVMAIAFAACAAVLAAVPRGRHWFSTWGTASLVVYLFHGFFVRSADAFEWFEFGRDNPELGLLAGIGFGIAVACFLGSPPVAAVGTWFVDPVGSVQRAYRKRSVQAPVGGPEGRGGAGGPSGSGGPQSGDTAEDSTASHADATPRSGA